MESSLIIDVVGNGPSCYDFKPAGNITVGCNVGLLSSKPNWLMIQDEYSLDCFITGKLKTVDAPAYLSLHTINLISTKWTPQQRKTLFNTIEIKKLSTQELHSIPEPFKFSRKNIITYGRGYKWEYHISCGDMAVLFAIIKHKPTHVRCWGFDAHLDGTVADLDHHLNRSDGYAIFDESILRRNRDEKYMHSDDYSRGEEYATRGFNWNKTLQGINSYFPEIKIEIMR